jgi:hypothetical protein
MKKLASLAVTAILSAAVYAVAQNAPVTGQRVELTGGVVTVDAGRADIMGNGTTFSRGVVISVNGVRITADRAVVEVRDFGGPDDRRAEEIRLEGTVRLSLLKRP